MSDSHSKLKYEITYYVSNLCCKFKNYANVLSVSYLVSSILLLYLIATFPVINYSENL